MYQEIPETKKQKRSQKQNEMKNDLFIYLFFSII